ncbi:MAG: hypothetical protein Q8P18_22560 [Pseudomonadota bacterium]|nr:hypothetical protein [Pseudomonadota bacterium]
MYHDFLILGGAGLVGLQVCRQILFNLKPRRIVVASLLEAEATAACARLEREFGDSVAFVPAWGNLFVPRDMASLPRGAILLDAKLRGKLLGALYDDYEDAYRANHLVNLIRTHRPEVIVDCVNTATGFSYQDVFDGAAKVRGWITEKGVAPEGVADMETFLLSQSVPQLIRHVRFLHQASTEYATKVYVKVGTTGTGGMGLNIPYTHSEDKPSKKLLAKNEAAFGHTGLLFLLARTPDSPIVKEVKPAAMIGYRAVQVMEAKDKHDNSDLYQAHEVTLDGGTLNLREQAQGYEKSGKLRVPVVDTGENGVFTRGEFAAITSLGQMEYITPEEIARTVVLEIRGANTGYDVISAMDGSVMTPSYKAGLVRSVALNDLDSAEKESGIPSVALGRLGPPELSKLLFEAELLRRACGTLENVLEASESALSERCVAELEPSGVARTAPSIGIPILLPDGKRLLRGPRINVPELEGHNVSVSLADAKLDAWAKKGWIDLRPANFGLWRVRIGKMLQARASLRAEGSAAASIHSYMAPGFEIGEVVAWIFNNEMGGYRVK